MGSFAAPQCFSEVRFGTSFFIRDPGGSVPV